MKSLKTEPERELSELTRLSITQIRRCKILLGFPEKYQNMMLAPQHERVKADFFIELERIRRPSLSEKLWPWTDRGDEHCIDIILEKYVSKTISAVTQFRDLGAQYTGAIKFKKLDICLNEFDRFLENPDVTIGDIFIPDVEYHKATYELGRSASRVSNQLIDIDDEALAADLELVKAPNKLAKSIRNRLRGALAIEDRDESN